MCMQLYVDCFIYFNIVSIIILLIFKNLSYSHKDLIGKRIGLFAYGSGLASTMFSLKIMDHNNNVEGYSLKNIVSGNIGHFANPIYS